MLKDVRVCLCVCLTQLLSSTWFIPLYTGAVLKGRRVNTIMRASSKSYQGSLIGTDMKFGVVVGRFNDLVTKLLLEGALEDFERHGVSRDDVDVVWVPGAYEIPLISQKLSQTKKYDAIICLGAVIRGSTSHYDHVCNEVSKGIQKVGIDTGVPCIFGVVTTDTIEQAIERAGTKSGNKGWEAALSGIEMANLIKRMEL